MMKKSVLLVVVLFLANLAFASVKKYDITLDKASKVGSTQLAAGTYKLKVEGDKATFTDAKNKTFTVTVKIENSKTKFSVTAVEATTKAGEDVIDAIDLAGTTTKVEF